MAAMHAMGQAGMAPPSARLGLLLPYGLGLVLLWAGLWAGLGWASPRTTYVSAHSHSLTLGLVRPMHGAMHCPCKWTMPAIHQEGGHIGADRACVAPGHSGRIGRIGPGLDPGVVRPAHPRGCMYPNTIPCTEWGVGPAWSGGGVGTGRVDRVMSTCMQGSCKVVGQNRRYHGVSSELCAKFGGDYRGGFRESAPQGWTTEGCRPGRPADTRPAREAGVDGC